MTHWCVSREPAARCGPVQDNGLMTGCHLRLGCLAAMCRTLLLLLVFSPVFSILCHISRASLNLQFTFRMRYLDDKADTNEMWGQSNLLCLMFKVVLNLLIFFHFTTWNYHCHFRWEMTVAPRGYLVNVKQGMSEPASGWACLPLSSMLAPSQCFPSFRDWISSKKLTFQETTCRYTPSRRFPKILIFTTYDWLWSFAFYSILFHFVRHETLNWFTDPEIGLNLWLEKHRFSCLDFASCANK